jgi:TolA-binding protein
MNLGRAIVLAGVAIGCSFVAVAVSPGVSPGPGIRYATDAYPGFDSEDELLKPSRKEPRWFGWINGPKKDTAAEQFTYAASLEAEESWKGARKAYDALVREWPTSPEAPKAQKAIADICLGKLLDSEDAFAEYRYLLDFYSAQCDYDQIVEQMYRTAELMRDEGKTILFFRFDNTVDVRRAYEAVVLRAPGAKFAPKAMLTIASLREDEDKQETAATVYENLRSMYPDSPEAATALYREAKARMIVLQRCEYNRERVRDTIGFLTFAIESGKLSSEEAEEVARLRVEALSLLEEEAYNSAKFYDSRTRTRRSAVSAYQRFLDEYPASERAPEIRRRLFELQEEGK